MHAITLALLLLAANGADKPAAAPIVHVRAAANAVRLLQETADGSATVRGLIARLSASDVIVYVELTPSPQIPLARTKLVTTTAAARFLRIGINLAVPPFDAPALIAHELQHAVEIADHAEVRDDTGMRRLYAKIGRPNGVDGYETDAARRAEQAARLELRRRSPAA